MRKYSILLFVIALVIMSALCAFGEPMLPSDVVTKPTKFINTTITVQGQISKFEKNEDLSYKYRYTLGYKGSELTVFTNRFVEDGQTATVSGLFKYDESENTYYLVESTGLPFWMYPVGGALVLVLLLVVVMIVKTSKSSNKVVNEPNVGLINNNYCDQCGGFLSANGNCPICSPIHVSPDPAPPVTSGIETSGGSNGSSKRSETLLMEAPSKAMLVLKNGKTGSFNLGVGSKKIGRVSSNDFVLDDDTVSSEHAKIIEEDGKFYVQDLGSRNGTFVNSEKVVRQMLNDGDQIELGKAAMKFVEISHK